MKKVLLIVLAITFLAAGIAAATVVDSHHDMRNKVASTEGSTQVCVYCHHPHVGNDRTDVLWNFSDGSASGLLTYTSPTINGADFGDALGSNNRSEMCMGCHDGSTSSDALYQTPGDATAAIDLTDIGGNMAAINKIGSGTSELQDDHPVDFDYTLVDNEDPGIKDADDANDLVVGATTSNVYPLFSGTMQCATCHDVHDGTTSETQMGIQFIRNSGSSVLTNSNICTDCHTNK